VDVSGAVRAAGGLVWRPAPRPDGDGDGGGDGDVEVLLVLRPKYDDWTLPKGKLLPGEDDAAGALREVEEETGMRGTLGPVAGTVRYRDSSGRPKVVVYYEMRPASEPGAGPGPGPFVPNHEVDMVRWMPKGEAMTELTYPHDRELLATFEPAR
jgi:8-oxo-dGTP pyrophosphatase MutT (NUDIX family)